MSMFGPSVLQSVAGTPYAARAGERDRRKADRREPAAPAEHRVDQVELADAVHEPEANDREEAREDRNARVLPERERGPRRPRLDVEG